MQGGEHAQIDDGGMRGRARYRARHRHGVSGAGVERDRGRPGPVVSGGYRCGTVLVPPKHFPKTPCNAGFGPTGVCVLARSVDPKTGVVFVPVRNDTIPGGLCH